MTLAESHPFPLTLRSPEVATGDRRASRRASGATSLRSWFDRLTIRSA